MIGSQAGVVQANFEKLRCCHYSNLIECLEQHVSGQLDDMMRCNS